MQSFKLMLVPSAHAAQCLVHNALQAADCFVVLASFGAAAWAMARSYRAW